MKGINFENLNSNSESKHIKNAIISKYSNLNFFFLPCPKKKIFNSLHQKNQQKYKGKNAEHKKIWKNYQTTYVNNLRSNPKIN